MAEFLDKNYPNPDIKLNVGGREVECTPEDTILFTYQKIGATGLRLSSYDHLLYCDLSDDTVTYGFLEQLTQQEKDLLMASMLANGYSVVANQENVADCDLLAYEQYVIAPKLANTDFVPDEWQT